MIFPFKWTVARKTTAGMKCRDAHPVISRAYNTPGGRRHHAGGSSALAAAARRSNGSADRRRASGRRRLCAVCRRGLGRPASAVREVPGVPGCGADALRAEAYLKSVRMPLVKLGPLPAGWRAGKPNVSAAYFDFLMLRWLDSETIAPPRPGPKSHTPKPKPPEPFGWPSSGAAWSCSSARRRRRRASTAFLASTAGSCTISRPNRSRRLANCSMRASSPGSSAATATMPK